MPSPISLFLRSVVPALRCSCPLRQAVSVCFAALSLLAFLTLPSRAGTWVITYSNSGSTSFDTIRPPSSLVNYTTNNSPTSNSASVTSGSGKVDFAANASIVATLTWQPASGQTLTTDPPPTSPVSILQTGTATEGPGPWNGSGPAPYPKGSASDGLGDPQTVSGDGHGYFSSGAHLSQQDGSSGTITIGPVTLSATCPHTQFVNGSPDWEGSSGVNVSLSVQVFPESVSISGTNNPAAGDYRVLTGQQITGTLQGVPAGYTVTKYTWSGPSATCFKTYNPNIQPPANNQLAPLASTDLSGPPSGSTPATGSTSVTPLAFYDSAAENLTLTCNLTLTNTAGSTLSVTAASPQIMVEKPTVTNWGIAEGYVQYDPNYASEQNGNLQTFGLYGNLSGTGDSTNGMIWSNVTVNVPAPFSGNGQCTFTQLVNPDHLDYNGTSSTPDAPNNGILGLDGSFEYGSNWNVTAAGGDVDSPALSVGAAGQQQPNANNYTQRSVSDAFTTYVMYQPSGGVWVPLEKFSWSWSETLTWQPSQWNLTASYPQTAGQAPTPTPAVTPNPPQWTVVH